MSKKHDIITIRTDTREQKPLSFEGLDVRTVVGTIHTLDYGLEDDHDLFAVEFKRVPDLLGSFTTTEGLSHEIDKIERALWTPLVYVISGRMMDVLPKRACPCVHERASSRCKECGSTGKTFAQIDGCKTKVFCRCWHERPALKCELCHGTGEIGYDYGRRSKSVTSQWLLSTLARITYERNVHFIWADSEVGAACCIENLLRRRHEHIKRVAKVGDITKKCGGE